MRNVEAKFRLTNLEQVRQRADVLGFALQGSFAQHDTFFKVANGKLKLREQEGAGAFLIHYRRERRGGLELSTYDIEPLANGPEVRAILGRAMGVLAEIRKRRVLMVRANVRLHLDTVEGLGDFGELEAVLSDGQQEKLNQAVVREILSALEIRIEDLIEKSYFELLRR